MSVQFTSNSREALQRLAERKRQSLRPNLDLRRGAILIGVVVSFVLLLASLQISQIRSEAEAYGRVFVRLYSGAEYETLYRDGTSADFRKFTDEKMFVKTLRSIRLSLGPVTSAEIKEFRYDYVRGLGFLHYRVRFERDLGVISLFLRRIDGIWTLWRVDVTSDNWKSLVAGR
jgi:hypothetical protein